MKDKSRVLINNKAFIKKKSILRRVGIILRVRETMSILYFYNYSEEYNKETVLKAEDKNII